MAFPRIANSVVVWARELFHLSPLDKALAIVVILLTFFSYGFKVTRIAGDEYLEFERWRVKFVRELRLIQKEVPEIEDSVRVEKR